MKLFSSIVLGNLLEIDENEPNICNTNIFLVRVCYLTFSQYELVFPSCLF